MGSSLSDRLLLCPLPTRAKGFFRHDPSRDDSVAVSKPVECESPLARKLTLSKSVLLSTLHLIKLEPPLSLLPSGNVFNRVPLEVKRTRAGAFGMSALRKSFTPRGPAAAPTFQRLKSNACKESPAPTTAYQQMSGHPSNTCAGGAGAVGCR